MDSINNNLTHNVNASIHKYHGESTAFIKIDGISYKLNIFKNNNEKLNFHDKKNLGKIAEQINAIFSTHLNDGKAFEFYDYVTMSTEKVEFSGVVPFYVLPASENNKTQQTAWKTLKTTLNEDEDSEIWISLEKEEPPSLFQSLGSFFQNKQSVSAKDTTDGSRADKSRETPTVFDKSKLKSNYKIEIIDTLAIDDADDADPLPPTISINGKEYAIEVKLKNGSLLNLNNEKLTKLLPNINHILSENLYSDNPSEAKITDYPLISLTKYCVYYDIEIAGDKPYFVYPATDVHSFSWDDMQKKVMQPEVEDGEVEEEEIEEVEKEDEKEDEKEKTSEKETTNSDNIDSSKFQSVTLREVGKTTPKPTLISSSTPQTRISAQPNYGWTKFNNLWNGAKNYINGWIPNSSLKKRAVVPETSQQKRKSKGKKGRKK